MLNIGKVSGEDKAEEPAVPVFTEVKPRPRPAITQGFTERVKIGCGNLYITVNYDENGICEVFTSTGKAGGCPSQSEATARLVSVALRSGISVQEIYDQLKGIRCPSTIRPQGMSCTSCPDAIAKVVAKVAKYIEENKQGGCPQPMEAERRTPVTHAPKASSASLPTDQMHFCPECGAKLEHEGGCVICRSCGFSKCG